MPFISYIRGTCFRKMKKEPLRKQPEQLLIRC